MATSLAIPRVETKSDLAQAIRENSLKSLYWFAQYVLGFEDVSPSFHLQFANFLQMHPWNGGPPSSLKKVAWLSRQHFKSSFCSVALPLWLLCHDRNLTIALYSAKIDNPQKWLRQIKNIIRWNPYFRMAFPEIRPAPSRERPGLEKWDETEIIITRDMTLSGEAQASITACSIAAGQASQHYDYTIIDDPVNEKTAKSDREKASAVETYKYMDSLGRGWGKTGRILVGTPYGGGDVMEWVMENQVPNDMVLYWGLGARGEFTCSQSLRDNYPEVIVDLPIGPPILPEKVPEEMLQQLEKEDVEKYYLQYLCKAYDLGRNGFDLDLIGEYWQDMQGVLHCGCEVHNGHNHDLSRASVIGTCDPAATVEKENCRSAVGVMAKFPCGCRFLLEEWAGRVDPVDTCEKIASICNRWGEWLVYFGIEDIGFQRMLKSTLEEMQAKGEIPAHIRFMSLKPQGRQKDARVRSQQTHVANRSWHIKPGSRLQEGVENMLWELSRFPLGKLRDVIDAIFGYCDDLWMLPEIHRPLEDGYRQIIDLNAEHEAYMVPKIMQVYS